MLCAPTLVLELSNFDRPKGGKFSLSFFFFLLFPSFISTNCFFFSLSLFLFLLSFFSFLFAFLFFFSFHLISLSFSLPFGWALPYGSREGNSLLPSSIQMHDYHNSILIPYFFIPLYDIIHYMAQYKPWDSFPTHGQL